MARPHIQVGHHRQHEGQVEQVAGVPAPGQRRRAGGSGGRQVPGLDQRRIMTALPARAIEPGTPADDLLPPDQLNAASLSPLKNAAMASVLRAATSPAG